MTTRLYILFFVLISLAGKVSAHSFLWDVDFYSFFDNREYKYRNQQSQTLFATRLSPEVGVSLPAGNASHRLMLGASWLQPVAAGGKGGYVHPTLYYRYVMPRFQMSFGMFPRTRLTEPLPAVLQYDSLTYYRPNITGALFQYAGDNGYMELMADWRQQRTTRTREAFDVVVSGRWQPGVFFTGGHFVLNHLSRSLGAERRDQSVMDDIVINPFLGADFARYTPLDILSLQCGYLLGLERDRRVGKWLHPQGFLCDIRGEWRWLGIRNTLYTGEGQMPFYSTAGSQLNQGDPFYRSGFYDRTDVYAYIFRNHFVNCKASFNIHFTPGRADWQQQLSVRLYLDDEIWRNRRNAAYKRPGLKDIL